MPPYSPSSSSLALRASIAQSLSGLRNTSPKVPFWELAAHRVPTLWTLYRGLLRAAPGENTQWRIRGLFQRNHHLTSPLETRHALAMGHRASHWLEYIHQAQAGDTRKQRVLARFERTFGEMKNRVKWKDIYRRELEWIYQLRNRPILTGGFMRPTLFHKLVPRMARQPIHLSMMIRRRRLARARRLEEQRRLMEWKLDIAREREFEARLIDWGYMSQDQGIWQTNEWFLPISKRIALIQEAYTQDKRRALHIYPPHIVAQVKQARTRRIQRKTELNEKLARGEWVTRWKRVAVRKMGMSRASRRLRGLRDPVHPHRDILYARVMRRVDVNPRAGAAPPHILQGMDAKERKMDQAIRGRSPGGYVTQLRREKGWKRGLEPGQGQEDERSGEAEARLKKLEDAIEAENGMRRRVAEIGLSKGKKK
ncbi:complex I LYR family [Rhizoctonia solani]|uniref:Complex I LYR family n=1 Tax=Rhizoctonia solani TaxID=456999 RepID=A0A8H7HEA9_9AGAM|nr:complex I LYR family [Rhizoctonia solani]